ncbi:TIR domain-containing protein [Burkholderia sp. Ac-20384]|uniref:TIR domain-containing protein n=1 Tax=Burkholderia sp. Ac-20384 TaxID=2703902 RepID=UPI00197D95B8|nr:TIR domain-containing protein [Burkholderia sp. Ac-20384]MBN3822598.1 TIR domain-containing protein [Burkholderia sp. Ac-20384]
MSYAKEDGAIVKEFHDHLKALGLDPWMDQERLLPGQAWEREIEKALNEANVVILFMSPSSVKKRSFVTREANTAVQNLQYKHADDIYVIPVLLEQCDVPYEISKRAQYIQYSEPGAKNKIIASIMRAAEQQDVAILDSVEHGPYKVFSRTITEKQAGQPGYAISIDYPDFSSDQFPEAAESLNRIFLGRATQLLVSNRTKPWDIDQDLYPAPDGELNAFHMNGRWDNFGIASATAKNISVYYNCSWYGAGAAHSNEFHETFNFAATKDYLLPFSLWELFSDNDMAAEIISQECRKSIAREYWNRCGTDIKADDYRNETFLTATAPNLSNFETFTITSEKLTFYFPPYTVAAYSFGSWIVDVPLYDLKDTLKKGEKSPFEFQ